PTLDQRNPAYIEALCIEVEDEEPDPIRLHLLDQAARVQEAVRRRTQPRNWEIFWRIVVEGQDVTDAAREFDVPYATAYMAARRIAKMLRAEGRRRLENPSLGD